MFQSKCRGKIQLGLLNVKSLRSKTLIVNEIITDEELSVLCLTETWIKTNQYVALNPLGDGYILYTPTWFKW